VGSPCAFTFRPHSNMIGKQKKNKGKKQAGNQGKEFTLQVQANPRQEIAFFTRELRGAPARLRRRLTLVSFNTGVTGANLAFGFSSGLVTTATEWASLSPNYQQYRVRAVRATLVPRNIFNNGFAATVWYPGTIVSARYPSGSSASSYAGIWAEGGAQVFSESQKITVLATMNDNPDAALFTDCNAGAPPALSQFGVQGLGSCAAPAIYNGVVTHDQFVEWDVEFIARN